MSPFVIIKVGMQEWRSEICFEGGRQPRWVMQFMEIPVFNLLEEVVIEVRDKDMIGSEAIGRAKLRLDFFAMGAGRQEWIELWYLDMPAGKIHFRSEWFPEVQMMAEGGMGMGGGRGGGGAGAMMAGAMVGAMVATDVMMHEEHRRRGPEVVVVNTHHRHRR